MDSIQIRRATSVDVPIAAEIHVRTQRETYVDILPAPYLQDLKVADSHIKIIRALECHDDTNKCQIVLVAEAAGGNILGFCVAGKNRDPNSEYDGELYAMYIPKEAQGLGVGALLFNAAQKNLKANGFMKMSLQVIEGNSATGFYNKLKGTLLPGFLQVQYGSALKKVFTYGWDLSSSN